MEITSESITLNGPSLKISSDKEKIQIYTENSRKIALIPDICRKVIHSGTIDEMISQQEKLLSMVSNKGTN